MLSTGFVGSAYQSSHQSLIPYPLPFGSSLSAFWLVLSNDGSGTSSSYCFTHGFLLGGLPVFRLLATALFPRFIGHLGLLLPSVGDMLSPLHLRERTEFSRILTFTSMVVKLSRFG